MADSLRDLVVNLSLNSENFTRNINSVNKEIREAESYFKMLGAGVQNFEGTQTGAAAKVELLNRQIELSRQVVEQYEGKLKAAQTTLESSYNKQQQLSSALEQANAKYAALGGQVEQARAKLDQFTESNNALHAATDEYQQLSDRFSTLGEHIQKTQTIFDKQSEAIDKAKAKYQELGVQLQEAKADYEGYVSAEQNGYLAPEGALDAAKAKIQQLSEEYKKAGETLQTLQSRHQQTGSALDTAKAKYQELGAQVEQARQRLLELNRTAAQDGQVQQARTEYEALSQAYKETGEEVKKLEGQLKANEKTLQNNANAVTTAQTGLNNAKANLRSLEAQLKAASSGWTKFGNAAKAAGSTMRSVGMSMRSIGRTWTRYITTPIIGLATAAFNASAEFEDSFASVEKVIHGTAEEMQALRDTSKQMSTEKPIDTSTINEIMMTAGQLGVAKENVKAFTDVIADLSLVGNNVDADEAATSIARFANITQGAVRAGDKSEEYFQNLGSTIYYLGNTMATTEPEIITMGQRLAAAGNQVGLTDADIMALAATLSSLGIQAQAGGTAFSKMLINMESAVAHGGEALDDFAKVSGMTSSEFKAAWGTDTMGVIQAFFNGIARLDDEGQSSIITLEELGIKEVRLRDAMLRTANANTLLVDASEKANAAWASGNKLTQSAQTRYKTMKNQMTMLKNEAKLLAQTFGNDLTPNMESFIGWAKEQISVLMNMTSEQRAGIVTNMAWAAGIGVALKLGGSLLTSVGNITTSIGSFAKAVADAGGGIAGLAKASGGLISAETGMIALAVAVGVLAYKFFDVVSGAKQAREALEAMQAQAEEWNRTRATTIYSGDNLAEFGVDKSAFEKTKTDTKNWLADLYEVWSDGKKETDEIVKQYTEGFTERSDTIREGLSGLRQTAEEGGNDALTKQIDADLKELDTLDKTVTDLLKKKQNGKLSDSDKKTLEDALSRREAIELKYKLTPEDGYEGVLKGVETEIAKAQARGESVDGSVFTGAAAAMAEGYSAATKSIDEWYDKQYEAIQLIEDEKQKQEALNDLNDEYNEKRTEAAQDYAKNLAQIAPDAFATDEMTEAQQQMADLVDLIGKYNMAEEGSTEQSGLLAQIQELTGSMDEGQLASYLALVAQTKDALEEGGFTPEELGLGDLNLDAILGGYATVGDWMTAHAGDMGGLAQMFTEALPEEVQTIFADLDMTKVEAKWAAFASNPGMIAATVEKIPTQTVSIYLDAKGHEVLNLPTGETIPVSPDAKLKKVVNLPTGETVPVSLDNKGHEVVNLPDGTTVNVVLDDEGNKVINLPTGEEVPVTLDNSYAPVVHLPTGETVAVTVDNNGKSVVNLPTGETVPVTMDANGNAVVNLPSSTTVPVKVDNAGKRVVNLPTGEKVAVEVDAEGKSVVNLPTGEKVPVTVDAEGNAVINLPTSETVPVVLDASYNVTNVPPTVPVTGSVMLAPIGRTITAKFIADNKIEGMTAYVQDISINPEKEAEIKSAFESGLLTILGTDGVPVDVTPEAVGALSGNELIMGTTTNQDGSTQLVVQIVPEVTSPEVREAEWGNLENDPSAGLLLPFNGSSISKNIDRIMEMTAAIQKLKDAYGEDDLSVNDKTNELGEFLGGWEFQNGEWEQVGQAVGATIKAIQDGGEISEEEYANLQKVLDLINGLDAAGMGTGVSKGIAGGMADYGFDGDATTVATTIETALHNALKEHSPSQLTKPIGEGVAEGIGVGMTSYSFSEASQLATKIKNAFILLPGQGQLIGKNFSEGLAKGIKAGKSTVIDAAVEVAAAGIKAAKDKLGEESPSKVMAGVGRYFSEGFAVGIQDKRAIAAIRNATGYATKAATGTATQMVTHNNQRTINNNATSNATVNVDKLYVRDQNDVRSISLELAQLNKMEMAAKGAR